MKNFTLKSALVFLWFIAGQNAFAQEPTNHPTGFTATIQNGTTIQLNWTGSTGANLPSHYLIIARTVPAGTFPTITDGNTVADETDYSDNLGSKNVAHAVGANTTTITVPNNTDLQFIIYAYRTGGAPTPDYLTSGSPLTATATTKLPTVTTPTVGAGTIAETTATLGGTITANGGNPILERGTVWKTTAGVTATDNKLAEGGTSVATFSHGRTGLPSGVRIYYAAYAQTIAGIALSQEKSFLTIAPAPDNQPASVTATAESPSQIELTFPAANTTGGNTKGYIILRSNTGADPDDDNIQDGKAPGSLTLDPGVTLVTTITDLTDTDFTDTGLSPDQQYNYGLVVFNHNTLDSTYNYKLSGGFPTDNATTFDNESIIVYNAGSATAGINYAGFQSSATLTTGNAESLGQFQIQDGGSGGDDDNEPTILTRIEFSVANAGNIREIAIFDGTTNVGQVSNPGSTVTFTGLNITANDDNTKNFRIRATFDAAVTDNDVITITITDADFALTGSSGFATSNAGGAASPAGLNDIEVTATKLLFVDPLNLPPAGPAYTGPITVDINEVFSTTVWAVDALNNRDRDSNASVTLTVTGGPAATVAGGGAAALTNGARTYNVSVNLADALYDLQAAGGGLTAASGSTGIDLTVESPGAGILQAAATSCQVGSNNSFEELGPLVLTEADPTDFEIGTARTFILVLPEGWEFMTPSIPGYTVPDIEVTPGANITADDFVGFTGTNLARFVFTVDDDDESDEITISGLYVKNVNAATTLYITTTGSAVIGGMDENTVVGELTVSASAPANFTVQESPNQTVITPTETNFSVSSAPIILNGQINGVANSGGVFSGAGVTYRYISTPIFGYRYTFNPSTLDAGTYPITYTYSDPVTGCISTMTKNFNVFFSSINGLQSQYCVNDSDTQTLTPNAAFIPAGWTFVNYSIQFQAYAFMTNVVNNGTSLTVHAPNHGLTNGSSYQIYIDGGFTGVGAPFGYIYGQYPVSNVTPNTFDLALTVGGNWFGYGYFYKNPNVTNVVRTPTTLTITANGHGLQEGVKVRIAMNGLSIDGGVTNFFNGWYTVSNVTTNTFDVAVATTGTWTSGTVDVFGFQISSFKPDMASSLNSNLTSIDFYYVGFFLKRTSCSGWQQCNEVLWTNEYVRINQLPVIDFAGLSDFYCRNVGTPVVLTGSRADGEFSVAPNFGLTDGGDNNNTASFMPNAGGITTEAPIDITYTFTDANNCTNAITKKTIVHALPTVDAGPNIDLCKGNSTLIGGATVATGNAPFGYTWNNGPTLDNSLIANPKASPTVTTAYTVSVVDAFGCTNTDITNVVLFDPATVNLGADPSICAGSDVTLVTSGATGGTATSATWSTPDGSGQFQNAGGSPNSTYGSGQATRYEPSATDYLNGRFTLTLTSNDPTGPCPAASGSLFATVKPLPPLTITSSASDLLQICQSDGDININANQVNGTWSGTASSALFNTNPSAGSTQLNPLNLAPGSFMLRYDYTDPVTTCSNFSTASLTILPTISPSLAIGDACDGFFTTLTNTSSIVPLASSSTIDSIAWDFGDQSSLPGNIYGDPIPAGFSDNTTGTFQSPNHIFKSVGSFNVNYIMKTSDGCRVTGTRQVINHEVPRAAFAWGNVCHDGASADVSFIGSNLNGNLAPAEIQSYTWDFAATSPTPVLNVSGSTGGQNPITTYTNTGRDSVQLIVTSIHNCRDTVQRPVFIVPSFPAITEFNSYSQDFNGTSGGWIDGGTNSSWEYGTPTPLKDVIHRDSSATGTGQAWVTNLDGPNNAGEQSWVMSPCFDFSQSTKPVISLDIWSDTPRRLDGAVLQYTDNANIANDANWIVLGQVGQGINWYDQNGISAKPGNQTSVDAGWTGDATGGRYKSWVHAIYRLDDVIGKTNVKFRIAFASGAGNQDGFAFDNIFIGERSRNVLIENFTNNSNEANSTVHNTFYNNFGGASSELVKVQFHTSFPGYDTLNRTNKQMNNARTAFYGITSSTTLRVDGKSGTGPVAGWFGNLFDERVLSPSSIKITINTPTKDATGVHITGTVTNVSASPINLNNAQVFVVIAEKSVTGQPWLGQSGNAEFKYVARQMLPSPAGINIGQVLNAGETFNIPEVLWNDYTLFDEQNNNGAVIIYVQSLLADKEVYQAEIFDGPDEPDFVTGIETPFAEQVSLYPNPSRGGFNIELPSPATRYLPVNLTDNFGREVYVGQFTPGERKKVISTAQFAAGVYFVHILSDKGELARKKIVITN
jgi:hypothetical protein